MSGGWRWPKSFGLANHWVVLTIAEGAGHPVSDGRETFRSRRWKSNFYAALGLGQDDRTIR